MTTFAPSSTTGNAAAAPRTRLYGVLAEFHDPASLLHAAEQVRDAGYRWWDCHTPFPV
ncbi:MAG: quinol:electron acceptor oxidoreductase subunit ActD, partial [Planctomycetota bacterium]